MRSTRTWASWTFISLRPYWCSLVITSTTLLAIVDGKRPDRWPSSLFKLFVWLWSPFGLTEEYFDGQAWKLVERFFQDATFEEVYGGLLYISAGTAAEAG